MLEAVGSAPPLTGSMRMAAGSTLPSSDSCRIPKAGTTRAPGSLDDDGEAGTRDGITWDGAYGSGAIAVVEQARGAGGASSGIGHEFCLGLAYADCRVVAAARRTNSLRSLCDEINSPTTDDGARAVAVELDVAARKSAREAAMITAWNAFNCVDDVEQQCLRMRWLEY